MRASKAAAVLALVAAACAAALAQLLSPTQLSHFDSSPCDGGPDSIIVSNGTSCSAVSCGQEATSLYKTVACPTSLSAPAIDESWGLYSAVNVYYDENCSSPVVFAAVKDGSCRNVGTVEMDGGLLIKISATSDCSLNVPNTKVCTGTDNCGNPNLCKHFGNSTCQPLIVSGGNYYARVECVNWRLQASQRTRYSNGQCSSTPTSVLTTQDGPGCKDQSCKAVTGAYETIVCVDDLAAPTIPTTWGVFGTAAIYGDAECKSPSAYAAIQPGSCYYVGDIPQQNATSIQVAAKADCTNGKINLEACINTDGQCGQTNGCQVIESTGCVPFTVLGSNYYIQAACVNTHAPSQYQRYTTAGCAEPPNTVFISNLTSSCESTTCEQMVPGEGEGYETVTCPGEFTAPEIESTWGIFGTAELFSDEACTDPIVYAAIKDGDCYYIGDINNGAAATPVAAKSECSSGTPTLTICYNSKTCSPTCQVITSTSCTPVFNSGYFAKVSCVNAPDPEHGSLGVALTPSRVVTAMLAFLVTVAVKFL